MLLLTWLGDHGAAWVTSFIAYIPVIATLVTCALSIVLARATLRQVEAADKSLELAREEFEREWAPELHIKLERVSANDVKVIVTNLAKASVLLQLLQIKRVSHAVPLERRVLNDPLVGGLTWTESIGDRLLELTGRDFDGMIAASVTFYAAGRMYRTEWFRFKMEVSHSRVMRLDAQLIPGRRARALRGTETGTELVKDVAAEPKEATPVLG